METAERPVIGATCLGPGTPQAIEMLHQIADLSMTMCETILVRGDTAPERVQQITAFLDEANKVGVRVLLEPTYEPDLKANPAMRNVPGDGHPSTRDNGFCYRNAAFLSDLGDYVGEVAHYFGRHPAVLRVKGRPVIAVGHEMQYQITATDGHGGALRAMTCYCPDCLRGFSVWLQQRYPTVADFNLAHGRRARNFDQIAAPRQPGKDRLLWQEWVDYHATAIPECIALQRRIIEQELPGALVSHEINDWYPHTWDCVYTGNHFWKMGEVLEHSFNDQYPMEWAPGSLWRIYLYTFTQDVNQSAMGFDRPFWTNGQAFPSWQGDFTEPPDPGYHEQVYSALIHGANGLIWWWGGDYLKRSAKASREYAKLVEMVGDVRPLKDPIAVLAPWTTFAQTRSSDRGDDLMGGYQLLNRLGYQVEIVDETQIVAGALRSRGYRALFLWGNSCLTPGARNRIEAFAQGGGVLFADFGDTDASPFGTVFPETVSPLPTKARAYTLHGGKTIAVRSRAQALVARNGSQVLSRYDDGRPAIARYPIGEGVLWRAGSLAGLDYAEGMGLYDWAHQERVRLDPAMEEMVAEELDRVGIEPLARSNNRNTEVGVIPVGDTNLVLVANHLRHPVQANVTVRIPGLSSVSDAFSGEGVDCSRTNEAVTFVAKIDELGGRAYWLKR